MRCHQGNDGEVDGRQSEVVRGRLFEDGPQCVSHSLSVIIPKRSRVRALRW